MHRPPKSAVAKVAVARAVFPNVYRYRFPAPQDAPETDPADEIGFALDFFAGFAALAAFIVIFCAVVIVPIVARIGGHG